MFRFVGLKHCRKKEIKLHALTEIWYAGMIVDKIDAMLKQKKKNKNGLLHTDIIRIKSKGKSVQHIKIRK